ncbi:MAG: hypothetical protein JRC86_12660 [Deltaproteobacteria bacterium]|nr:hypothetical protein [Deltaproteobacteria bacterium]
MARKKLPKKEYWEKYYLMAAAEKGNGGFTLTNRDLMVVWSYGSTSSVAYCLTRMFEYGFLHRRQYGKTYKYRTRHFEDVDYESLPNLILE